MRTECLHLGVHSNLAGEREGGGGREVYASPQPTWNVLPPGKSVRKTTRWAPQLPFYCHVTNQRQFQAGTDPVGQSRWPPNPFQVSDTRIIEGALNPLSWGVCGGSVTFISGALWWRFPSFFFFLMHKCKMYCPHSMKNVVKEPSFLQFVEICSRIISLSKLSSKVDFCVCR